MLLPLRLLFAVFLVVEFVHEVECRSAKEWAALSEKELEEMWKQGDEEDELKSEADIYQEMIEKRKKNGGMIDISQIEKMKPDQVQAKMRHAQSETGMAMIFVTLSAYQEDGTPWTEADEQKIAAKFAALLQTGGLKINSYRIDPRRLLVTMQTGWYGADVKDFLLEQPTVMKITWDSVDYLNPNVKQVEVSSHNSINKKENKKKKKKKTQQQRMKKQHHDEV
eukprot:CAMPEP_0197293400 /NCGR_PEP_ID=MMETSP0890-20130614/28290_1 /TAXON_ID=44058 ORGANISM="Aureoumbra lagunensis, Strain CCMP1510" /NCGR_SAMPLE_ID=MMETSP0890 /ASSEMBLY_ACC=CAM_ASM_000533 /LENGTH=222 /DNA_ID=CAMNT_0042768095 /DNA_START=238 /DNA_END=906 /DNA_ORIENTATION=+